MIKTYKLDQMEESTAPRSGIEEIIYSALKFQEHALPSASHVVFYDEDSGHYRVSTVMLPSGYVKGEPVFLHPVPTSV